MLESHIIHYIIPYVLLGLNKSLYSMTTRVVYSDLKDLTNLNKERKKSYLIRGKIKVNP